MADNLQKRQAVTKTWYFVFLVHNHSCCAITNP